MTDRTSPPEHYRVTHTDICPEYDDWYIEPLVDSVGICIFARSLKVATDLCWRHFDAVTAPLRTEVERLTTETASLRAGLQQISDIRDSIVGSSTVNWSEHVYPMVAALNSAGFVGADFDDAHKSIGTLIERYRIAAARACLAEAKASDLEAEIASLRAERDDALREPESDRRFSIKVEVQPGQFASERNVSFSACSQQYTLIVDAATDLDGENLKVAIIGDSPGRWIVRLPRETFTSGRNLSLPRELVFLRAEVPLRAEVERLTAELAAASKALGTMAETIVSLNDEAKRLTADLEAARAPEPERAESAVDFAERVAKWIDERNAPSRNLSDYDQGRHDERDYIRGQILAASRGERKLP